MSDFLFPVSMCFFDSILSGIYVRNFLKEKYEKKAIRAIWITAYFLIQVSVFRIWNGKFPVGKAVEILFHVCILLFMQTVFFQKEIQKQFFVAFSFVAGTEMARYMFVAFEIGASGLGNRVLDELLARGILDTLEKALFGTRVYNAVMVVSGAVFYALLLSGYLFLIRRKFVKKDYLLQPQENIFLILPCAAALCISIIASLIINSLEDKMAVILYDAVPSTKFWMPVICALLFSAIIANVILFQKLVQYNEETGKCALLENQVKQMQKEIVEIQDIYADMRGLQHDMRSHLANISLLVRSGGGLGREELEGYIGKMEQTVRKLDFVYRTGNPITDVIIHQKGQEAEKKQIEFTVDFAYPSRLWIDVYDIAVVVNNALENAIEACGRAEGAKQIKLRSYVKGSLFFIEIENDFSGNIRMEKESGLPVSSKENAKGHGIGILNIQRCARKYMGDIDIAISDGESSLTAHEVNACSPFDNTGRKKFCLTVMMNGKSAAEI